MHLETILRTTLHRALLPLPLTVSLLACSGPMYGQSSQANVCHMDSTGFCLPDDPSNPNPPSGVPVVGTNLAAQSISAPPDKLSVAQTPVAKPRLEIEIRDGLLRVLAEHVSLRDVLKAISASTGAELQFPMGALQEQVFVHLGLGTPQDVVRELLKGSHFNYVILAPNSDPSGIARLILSKTPTASNGNSLTAPALSGDEGSTPTLYGEGFATDANGTSSAEVQSAPATPSWVHHDGPALSGEQLDQMQKAMIQQEQEQFAQQLQEQKRQQEQDQANQNPPQQ